MGGEGQGLKQKKKNKAQNHFENSFSPHHLDFASLGVGGAGLHVQRPFLCLAPLLGI